MTRAIFLLASVYFDRVVGVAVSGAIIVLNFVAFCAPICLQTEIECPNQQRLNGVRDIFLTQHTPPTQLIIFIYKTEIFCNDILTLQGL